MIDKKNAKKIVELIGGKENVKSLTHCATRLRFRVYDDALVKSNELEKISDVLKVMKSGGQQQVVIGPEVADMYDAVLNIMGGESSKAEDSVDGDIKKDKGKKFSLKNIINIIFDVLSGTFTPVLPAMAGVGMIKAISILLTDSGLMATKATTITILNGMYNGFFYFLPIILSISMGKKLKTDPFVAGVIGAALLEPSIVKLVGVNNVTFMGLPIIMQNYASTVFPVLLSIPIYAFIYHRLNKIIPKNFQMLFVPFISVFIVVPLVLFILGPFGMYVGKMIATFITFLFAKTPLLAGAFVGSTWTLLVLFGLHWSIIPIAISNISTQGSDPIVACAGAATWAAIGVVIGLLIKSKDKNLKSLMVAGLVPLLFAGVSEPVLYGATLRYKRILGFSMISGAIGGALMALVKTRIRALFFSILALQTSINWIQATIAGLITVVITALLIIIFDYQSQEQKEN